MTHVHNITTILLIVAFFAFSIPQTTSAATDIKNDDTLADNLASYWEFEEESGTRVDSHGSNDLTSDINTVLFTTGIQGNAADFELSNSESLRDPGGVTGLDIGTGAFTINAWIKRETLNTNMNYFVKQTISPFKSMQLRVSSDGKLGLYMNDGSTSGFIASTDGGTNDTDWHMVTITRAATAGAITFCIDGAAAGTGTKAESGTIANERIEIGENNSTAYFDGLIDEMGFWTRELTSSEVSELWNSGSGIPYEAEGGAEVTEEPYSQWW